MHEWTFAQLPPSAFAVAIGMINTGKTLFGRAYVQAQPDPSTGVVIHMRDSKWDKRYTDLMPSERVYDDHDYCFEELTAILSIIKSMEPAPSFVVVDDCLWARAGGLWRNFLKFILHCNYYRIPLFVTMIYGMGIPQRVKDIIDIVIVTHQGIETNVESIFIFYGIGLESYEQFRTLNQDVNTCNRKSTNKYAIVLTRDAQYHVIIPSKSISWGEKIDLTLDIH